MIIEKLYEVTQVDTLPRGLDLASLIGFMKETQSYEWAMASAKSEGVEEALAKAIDTTPLLYRFTKPVALLGLDLNLAYLDVTRDTSRPMMTNYHKNQVRLYKKEDTYKLYLNGQAFLSLNEKDSDALLAFELKKDTLYFKGRYFASGDELGVILSLDELFKLVLNYTYLDESLVLPSYQAYEALERLRRTSYVSLNKRFLVSLGKSDNVESLLYLASHSLTKANQIKTSVDSVILLGYEESQVEAFEKGYKKVAGKDARLMKVEDERAMMIAMSRDIEVIFLNEALLETFFMYLPNWRTKKIAYLITDENKNADYLWQRLDNRTEKERSMALYFNQTSEEITKMIEV